MTEQNEEIAFEVGSMRLALGALVVGLVLGFLIGRGSATMPATAGGAPASAPGPERFAVETEGRPAQGPADAPVTIVEFTDYECPYCRRYYRETYDQVLSRYRGRIRYVVRNYPLPIHPNAPRAAEAAECAAEQGLPAFWSYHDALFEREADLSDETLYRLARETGLEPAQFRDCLESGRTRDVVERDVIAARNLGIRGTPAFFINGRRVYGAQPFEVFRAYIEDELARSD